MEPLCLEGVTRSVLLKKAFCKIFAIFTWKHLCWSLKREILWILWNLSEQLFWRTSANRFFLSMKTDLLNAHGLCEQCSITHVREMKICSEGVWKWRFFLLFTTIYPEINMNIVKTIFADTHSRKCRFPSAKASAIAGHQGKFQRLLSVSLIARFNVLI